MNQAVGREAAAAFLVKRYEAEVTNVAELGGGDWSRAYSFRLQNRDLVARFGRYGEDFYRDQKAMAFACPELPVPRVLEIGEALGGYYAISERHYGVFLEDLDETGWRRLLPAFLRMLDALREVELPGKGIDWGNDDDTGTGWRDWLLASLVDCPGERVGGWREKLQALPAVEEVFVRGEQAIHSLVGACPDGRHLLHRDLLHRNVLVAEDATRLEAVFDWACSTTGDFLYEVAWLTFWSPWHPGLEAIDFHTVIQNHYAEIGLQVENFNERLACYEVQIGLEHLAYCAFTNREEDLHAVARRTVQVFQQLP